MELGDIGTAFIACVSYCAFTAFCGYAPSLIKAPPKFMNLFTIFSSGTIIGAILGIVLPESAMLLAKSQNEIARITGTE